MVLSDRDRKTDSAVTERGAVQAADTQVTAFSSLEIKNLKHFVNAMSVLWQVHSSIKAIYY